VMRVVVVLRSTKFFLRLFFMHMQPNTRFSMRVNEFLQHVMINQSLWVPGGSMVARLKLKGIDGRASPGVEPAA